MPSKTNRSPRSPRRTSALRVAAVQLRSVDDYDSNVERIHSSLAQCASEGVQVAAFPECAVTGYDAKAILRPTLRHLRQTERELAETCRRHRISALVGIPWRSRDEILNSVIVIDQNGRLVTRHLKVHLVGGDRSWGCKPGNTPCPVFPIGRALCSVFICHDSRYPELCRLPVLAGARVLFYISHEASLTKESKIDPYRAQIQARAAENGVFVVHANAPANSDLSASHGQSRIVGPGGNILQEASIFDEEVLIADLELSEATADNALRSLNIPPLDQWWRDGMRHVRVLK
jgi:predicted amidohydrolase